ncbi:MAG: rhodanese-like domain-containing protein [Longimicrobiales bacterium]
MAPEWLREHLRHPRVRVVDLRDADAFATGNVPRAVHLELAALGTKVGACDNVLLPPAEFGALMSRLGISNADTVIAYDDQWGLAAARLLWSLHRYGHQAVAVLDGGWDRWVAEGGAPNAGTTDASPAEPSVPFVADPREEVFADRAWVAARARDRTAALLDTRAPAEMERGHIPGAIGWDWFNAVPNDSWSASRDPAELRGEWAGFGLDGGREVAVYCRSGMRAAHTYMVLKHAGFARVRLYDGSWQDWAANTETKV